ncbi:response regulator transcription factor [Cryptosporangium phraense]|uniref:Response regulator transcription factor n=1 Tax=Cryptosporangium phraense TaxID=2593070 RepID=A0A545AS75_9ACTN|nr:response regulator transcription factor [Cryptosporangium phraense]
MRVAVADDHPMFRAGLRGLIEDSAGLEFAGEASDGAAAVELCRSIAPDVLLMDLRMPGLTGVDATRRIVAEMPGVAVLVLTMVEDDTSLLATLRAGARGYLLKGAAPDEIATAVKAAASGQVLFGAGIADRLTGLLAATRQEPHPFPELSARERDVLDLLAQGRANPDIARRLGLSEKTVRNNVSAILAKLRVADRPSAIVRAREAGLGARPGAQFDGFPGSWGSE